MLEQEIAKELTLKAIEGLDRRFGTNKTAIERNEIYAQEVAKLYNEIFKAVVSANDHLNK